MMVMKREREKLSKLLPKEFNLYTLTEILRIKKTSQPHKFNMHTHEIGQLVHQSSPHAQVEGKVKPQGFIVDTLIQHFYKRLFSRIEPMIGHMRTHKKATNTSHGKTENKTTKGYRGMCRIFPSLTRI